MKYKTIRIIASLMMAVPAIVSAGLKPGSVVVYSDGDVEKLLVQNQEWSLWEDQRKRQYKRAYLPYFPVLEYRRFAEQPSGYDQFVPNMNSIELMPFSSNESVRFTVIRRDLSGVSKSRLWHCNYIGNGSYRLSKEDLVTQDYSCTRYVIDKYHTSRLREKQMVSYSPSLNLVVKQIRTDRFGNERQITVERILTPKKATAKRISRAVYKIKNR